MTIGSAAGTTKKSVVKVADSLAHPLSHKTSPARFRPLELAARSFQSRGYTSRSTSRSRPRPRPRLSRSRSAISSTVHQRRRDCSSRRQDGASSVLRFARTASSGSPAPALSMLPASPSRDGAKRGPRRFAPLDPSAEKGQDWPKLKGIIFDVDGTLCLPQNYMFKEMRAALDIPRQVDILDHIRSLSNEPDTSPSNPHSIDAAPHSLMNAADAPSEEALSHGPPIPGPPPSSPQKRALATVQAIERRAMTSQRPQPGLQKLMAYLTRRGVRKALCTRNFPTPVHHLLSNHLADEVFEPIITRETEGVQPKPSPEGLWTIAQAWGLHTEIDGDPDRFKSATTMEPIDPLELAKQCLGSRLIMVGDSLDDMAAGRRAGAATVLLANEENEALTKHEYTDLSIRRLDELIDVLERGFEVNV